MIRLRRLTQESVSEPSDRKRFLNAAGRGAYRGTAFNFGDELRGLGEAGGVKRGSGMIRFQPSKGRTNAGPAVRG